MDRKMIIEYQISNFIASQEINLANISIKEMNNMYLDSIESGINFEVIAYE